MVADRFDNKKDILEEALTQFVNAYVRGEKPDIDEFVKQYPQYEAQIRRRVTGLCEIDALFDSLVQADESDFEDAANGQSLVGRKVGNFEIAEIIGRGGMGVVYLARDTRLKRSVAIKSIPSQLKNNSTARMRFSREAELLASLNHPNIAVIHDIIEQEDVTGYLVLEYVPGETLSERIKREPFELEEALSIALQIAEAVSAAHEKGVVHRDLKPGNIKITPDGRVKILDFGLAKPSVKEGADIEITSTQPGHIIGTPAYMSPEQARGKPSDHRTDIWSFGCIIYQMLTGHSPFESDTATDTIARIIERQPDWELLPKETPENIRVLLQRCLEKEPEHRLGNIADAAIEISETLSKPTITTVSPARTIWRWTMVIGLVVVASVVVIYIGRWRKQMPTGSGRIESLAVLPLENLSGDPNQEYFSDGMTEALMTELSKIGTLRVISRTSVMRYKQTDKLLPEIARELDVDAVVVGSVLRVAERVSFTVQLINVEPEQQLWANNYERDFGDILILSGEITKAIARRIEITLTPNQEARLVSRRPINNEIYKAYLRGMFHLYKMTPEGIKKGLEYLRQAIEKDPADPLAYAGLARGYSIIGHGFAPSPEAFPRARAAALRALRLDETLAEAYAVLADVKLYYDWEWEVAEQAFQEALKLNPNLADARGHYSWYLWLFGRRDEAFAEMKRAQGQDPLAPIFPSWQGVQYFWAGQYEKAIDKARKSLELDPDFANSLWVLGSAYAAKGMYEEAIEAHQKMVAVAPDYGACLGHTYALAGQRDKALNILAELGEEYQKRNAWGVAEIYAALGEKDEAFRWLEAGHEYRHNLMPWMGCNPNFKPLYDDPRFDDLLRRMKIPK